MTLLNLFEMIIQLGISEGHRVGKLDFIVFMFEVILKGQLEVFLWSEVLLKNLLLSLLRIVWSIIGWHLTEFWYLILNVFTALKPAFIIDSFSFGNSLIIIFLWKDVDFHSLMIQWSVFREVHYVKLGLTSNLLIIDGKVKPLMMSSSVGIYPHVQIVLLITNLNSHI